MKILHTADWHIGKIVNDFSLLDEQRYIFNNFYNILENEKPDIILICGDVYDRSIPPKEAVELLDEVLTRIIEEFKIPTLIVTGNHDSQERLSFGSKIFTDKRLYIEGVLSKNTKKITFNDEYGPINFYLVPYSHPASIRNIYKNESINNHQDALKVIIENIKNEFRCDERNVLVTHNYIASNIDSILESDSERRLSVGGTKVIDVSIVEGFDYVALGHLHQGQKVKKDNIRYSGSILKYSFSEVKHQKGINLIELKDKGSFTHHFVELKPKNDMVIIEGKLDTLLKPSFYEKVNRNDYLLIKLTDDNDLYDPLGRLRMIYPNIMQIQRKNVITNVNSQTKANNNFQVKSKLVLFSEYYNKINGKKMTKEQESILSKVIDEVIKGEKV